jgi:hypothetical protein
MQVKTSASFPYPQVTDLSGIVAHAMDTVCLVGTYEWADLSMKAPGDRSKVYKGYAVIRLRDKVMVHLLPTSDPLAIRSNEERKAMEGKKVNAVGVISRFSPDDAGHASLGLPCLLTLESLTLR